MNVYFVYLEEKDPAGQSLRYDPVLFDQFMAMAGGEVRYVRALKECEDLFHLEWVFLDHRADRCLGDFNHPDCDVVYCTGADDDGFDGQVMPILSQRLRVGEEERHGFPILLMAAADRALRRILAWR